MSLAEKIKGGDEEEQNVNELLVVEIKNCSAFRPWIYFFSELLWIKEPFVD